MPVGETIRWKKDGLTDLPFRRRARLQDAWTRNVAWPLLILAIQNMILISIQPFAFRKLFAFAVAVICLSTASCFASLIPSGASAPYGVCEGRQNSGRSDSVSRLEIVANDLEDRRAFQSPVERVCTQTGAECDDIICGSLR